MPKNCEWVNIDGMQAVICGGRARRKACYHCGRAADFLCDFPAYGKSGKRLKKDCDRPLCGDCTQKGISGQTDFCKDHYPIAQAAHLRRESVKNG